MTEEPSYLSYFTPGLMSHAMLESILVKRQSLAVRLVAKVEQSVLTEAKHQTLLLGPRGIGKSYLVALVYHRVKALPELTAKIAIAWFAEEEWSVSSLTDLLLVILKSLDREYGGLKEHITALYRLPVREIECVAGELIREFVGERTLFILVENLDEIFRGLGDAGQWAFRSYLSERPFVTILATTPSLFDGISQQKAAFYGYFQNIYLEELTVEEATELLENLAERRGDMALTEFLKTPSARDRVQAVHDLAGGHPRIYLLFAHLLTQESLDELVTPFLKLLDELTPYYQNRMQLLSPQQRKIVEFLCSARGAIPVKEIAAQNLMSSQTASSQLEKLEVMAYVRKTPVGRESLYELREPLLRMVIEVKRGRGEPVRLIVDFLRRWYNRRERQQRLAGVSPAHLLTKEYLTASLDLEKAAQDTRQPDALRLKSLYDSLSECFSADKLEQARDLTAEIIEQQGQRVTQAEWLMYAYCLLALREWESALPILNRILPLQSDNETVWSTRSLIQFCLGNYSASLADINRAIEIDATDWILRFNRALIYLGLEQWNNFVEEIRHGISLHQGSNQVSGYMGELCRFILYKQSFHEKVPLLLELYAEFDKITWLGEGLTESISPLLEDSTPQSVAEEWLRVWTEASGERAEMEIPLRILAAAVEWKKTRNSRALLALSMEERRILESLLPKEKGAFRFI